MSLVLNQLSVIPGAPYLYSHGTGSIWTWNPLYIHLLPNNKAGFILNLKGFTIHRNILSVQSWEVITNFICIIPIEKEWKDLSHGICLMRIVINWGRIHAKKLVDFCRDTSWYRTKTETGKWSPVYYPAIRKLTEELSSICSFIVLLYLWAPMILYA